MENHDVEKDSKSTENNNEYEDLNPEVLKILNFEIPERKINRNCLKEHLKDKHPIVVGDLINWKTDMWQDKKVGKCMLNYNGVLEIGEAIGVEWTNTPQAMPNDFNDRGYNYLVKAVFADGSKCEESGEANDLNTEIGKASHTYKQNQAIIRGKSKSLIRGLGLYRVLLTEEEADEFKKPEYIKAQEEFSRQFAMAKQQWQERERNLLKIIEGIMNYVALPNEDAKYPREYMIDVWKKFHDKEYLLSLTQSDDKKLGFVATQLYKKLDVAEKKNGNEVPTTGEYVTKENVTTIENKETNHISVQNTEEEKLEEKVLEEPKAADESKTLEDKLSEEFDKFEQEIKKTNEQLANDKA